MNAGVVMFDDDDDGQRAELGAVCRRRVGVKTEERTAGRDAYSMPRSP